MSDQRRQILQMLAEGKITAEDAERLLDALNAGDSATAPESAPENKGGRKAKFMRVIIKGGRDSEGKEENVNIKIPAVLLKSGIRLGSIMPKRAIDKLNTHFSDKGLDINMNDLDVEKLDHLLEALTESPMEILSDDSKIIICCE